MIKGKTRKTVLVIDDDRLFCDAVSEYFRHDDMDVLAAHTGKDGIETCMQRKTDIVLLDQNLPDMDGHDCCPDIVKHNEQTKIIFITAFPSYKSAVAAVKAGAYDYLSKPFELEELRLAVERCVRTIDLEDLELFEKFKDDKNRETAALVGSSPAFIDFRKVLDIAASEDAPVLITGETGTGKTLAAKYIHNNSARNGQFIFVNCAALPETLIESELFGHEKGAFTNAMSPKKGVFELADGGTLFLDEIGAMPMHLQPKLLSAIDEGKIRRLGGETMREVNVRIIAATNTDLDMAILKKEFRDDLYYRLSVIRIHIPPLRERLEDIPELSRHFLADVTAGRCQTIPEDEMTRLKEYSWPGNIRELRNILERACMLRNGGEVSPSGLLFKDTLTAPAAAPHSRSFTVRTDTLPELVEVEDDYIRYVFETMSGNFTHTADALGISRSTLKRRFEAMDSRDGKG